MRSCLQKNELICNKDFLLKWCFFCIVTLVLLLCVIIVSLLNPDAVELIPQSKHQEQILFGNKLYSSINSSMIIPCQNISTNSLPIYEINNEPKTETSKGNYKIKKETILFIIPGHGNLNRVPYVKNSVDKVFSTTNLLRFNLICRIYIYELNDTIYPKGYLEKIINTNDTNRCNIIYHKGSYLENLVATSLRNIDYILVHLDDVDIPEHSLFNMTKMVDYLNCNNLDVLSNSVLYGTWKATRPFGDRYGNNKDVLNERLSLFNKLEMKGDDDDDFVIGRTVASIEPFSYVFTYDALACYINQVLDISINIYGYRYEFYFGRICNVRQGVLDYFIVEHRGTNKSYNQTIAMEQAKRWENEFLERGIIKKKLNYKIGENHRLGDGLGRRNVLYC